MKNLFHIPCVFNCDVQVKANNLYLQVLFVYRTSRTFHIRYKLVSSMRGVVIRRNIRLGRTECASLHYPPSIVSHICTRYVGWTTFQ